MFSDGWWFSWLAVILEPGLDEFLPPPAPVPPFFITLETLPELTLLECFERLSFSRLSTSANFCFCLWEGFFDF